MWKPLKRIEYVPFFQRFSTVFSEPWMQCTDNFLYPPETVDIAVRDHRDPQKSFLIFSVFHKGSALFFLRGCTDRFGLVYGQPFHQPPSAPARRLFSMTVSLPKRNLRMLLRLNIRKIQKQNDHCEPFCFFLFYPARCFYSTPSSFNSSTQSLAPCT